MTTPLLTDSTISALRSALLLADRDEGRDATPGDYGRLRELAIALGVAPGDLDDDLGAARRAEIVRDYNAAGRPALVDDVAAAVIVPRFAIATLVSRGRDAIRDDATIGERPDADTIAALRAAATSIGEGDTIDDVLAETGDAEEAP
jgi:hypothetical protein